MELRIRYDLANTYAPPVDYFLPCQCQACQLGTLLWHTDEERHPRAWQAFWNTIARELESGPDLPRDLACWRQLRAWGMAMTDGHRNGSGLESARPSVRPSSPTPGRPRRAPPA